MTVSVVRSRVVHRPVVEVAPLITDPDLLLPFLRDFGRFEPVGNAPENTEYDVFLNIGTIHVGGRVEVSRPDEHTFFWHSTRGTTHTLELHAGEHEQGALLTMSLLVTLDGLAVARIAELLARPIMDRTIVACLEQLRHAMEYDRFA